MSDEMNQDEFGNLIGNATMKIGLSFFVFAILLPIFWLDEIVNEFGIPQYAVIIVLHITTLYLLFRSSKEKNPNSAIAAMLIGVAWNFGMLVYITYIVIVGNLYYIDIQALGKQAATVIFLAGWYAVSIYKFHKYKQTSTDA